jgi:hypothetical protein
MKRSMLIICLLFHFIAGAQRKLTPVGFYHKENRTIAGLGLGIAAGSVPGSRTYGIHLEVLGFAEAMTGGKEDEPFANDSIGIATVKNTRAITGMYGLNTSYAGTVCRQCEAYGLNLNGAISVTQRAYGVTVSSFVNHTDLMYGMQIAMLGNGTMIGTGLQAGLFNRSELRFTGLQVGGFNFSNDMRGLQIGLYNRSKKLKGLQIGMWNKNDKRSFPIINW